MRAMVLSNIVDLTQNKDPLKLVELPKPQPSHNEVLVKVSVCGVCHTELDEIEGRTPPLRLPMVPGHQAIGTIEEVGSNVQNFQEGDRVGISWIYSACGQCRFCKEGKENLCQQFLATGRDVNGGYAEYMTIHSDFAFSIPKSFSDKQAAPMLCAGAIGYRSLMLTAAGNGKNFGLTGFGASGHLVLYLIRHLYPDSNVYVFARNPNERAFALKLGAAWAGDTMDSSPDPLDAIIDTTPVWKPVVEALRNLKPDGRFVMNAIRKEDGDKEYLMNLDYTEHLWMEKELKSVANVTRKDVADFLKVAAEIPIKPQVQKFTLEKANEALMQLKAGNIKGAKVLTL
ncbi:MAG: alcohol dehydrogenase catalytic domain-containing protein [Caldithrix sp.]|nr:alcohol dehydrogenase catalytic domain-containing protein [Caldithrix sp.]